MNRDEDNRSVATADNGIASASADLGAERLLENSLFQIKDKMIVPINSTGYIMISQRLLQELDCFLYDGHELFSIAELENIHLIQDSILQLEGLQLLRLPQTQEKRVQEGSHEDPLYSELLERMLLYRAELCAAGLELVRQHLSGRVSGNGPTLQNQLVKGNITDILTILEMIKSTSSEHMEYSCSPVNRASLRAMLHQELDRAFGLLQKLGGGHGYVNGPVMYSYYISQAVKNIYYVS
ncbi:hypothetical protein TCA2_2798 [Paenibacillus sp. TCA20]|uniref:hypothetical protein n=1 Tax=Paenibacillus TaxID=44249 RepID=UPI0004D3F166|nr:hypothetical protein [Paenibacillus sp. TCA20]GAK40308.1 hypothetical protein TCA2_2798 [Paenibacillus sp. TCA20]